MEILSPDLVPDNQLHNSLPPLLPSSTPMGHGCIQAPPAPGTILREDFAGATPSSLRGTKLRESSSNFSSIINYCMWEELPL